MTVCCQCQQASGWSVDNAQFSDDTDYVMLCCEDNTSNGKFYCVLKSRGTYTEEMKHFTIGSRLPHAYEVK